MPSQLRRNQRVPITPFDHVPFRDPGIPSTTTAWGLLYWIARNQLRIIATGSVYGILGTICLAVLPGLLGRAIQAISDHDNAALNRWAFTIIGLGVVQAFFGVMRHRRAAGSWLIAATRLKQIIARKASALGADLPRLVATGEVVSVNNNDVERMARGFDNIPRLIGAVISFIYVSILLISSSRSIGILVVICVPLMSLAIAPIIKPLQEREAEQRRRLSVATNLAADTVAGLRVLRGIGGEEAFIARFKNASQEVRAAAVLTARMRSLLQALQIVLPGVLVLVVIYFGGHLVVNNKMDIGALLSFYGYSAFLVLPIKVILETAQRMTAAYVSAGRVIHLLSVQPINQWGANEQVDANSVLRDAESGVEIRPRELLVVVSESPLIADDLCDRLGGYVGADDVFLGSEPLTIFSRSAVRKTIFVQEKEPSILSGTIGSIFEVSHSGRITIEAAMEAASAGDILDSLDGEGMSAEVVERGRTLSGGQRQRLALARTLFVDAPIAILDDPTSAVDAHTESRIASRLGEIRKGMTTVVFTNSPLILDHADRVILLLEGKAFAEGTHEELFATLEIYRELVTRGA
ncbi:MAG: ABC transporter ATP-binding protein [Actinomycetota bacterium]